MDIFNEIVRDFKKFKLGNSVYTSQMSFNKLEVQYKNTTVDAMSSFVRQDCIKSMATFIVNKHPSSITKEETSNDITYRCELMVLEVKDFKTIVEAVIQSLPNAEIDKIKACQI